MPDCSIKKRNGCVSWYICINACGFSDPLQDHPDVYPAAVFGPSIRFGGFRAQWAGDSGTRRGEVAIEARVSFETCAGDRTMSFLDISNDGTAAVYFSWKVCFIAPAGRAL